MRVQYHGRKYHAAVKGSNEMLCTGTRPVKIIWVNFYDFDNNLITDNPFFCQRCREKLSKETT